MAEVSVDKVSREVADYHTECQAAGNHTVCQADTVLRDMLGDKDVCAGNFPA